MSFILDALRKSENERQKQSAPSLADARYQVARKKRNVWLPVITVVLAANAIGLAVVLLNDDADEDSPGTPAAVSAPVRPVPVVTEPAPAAPMPVPVIKSPDPTPSTVATPPKPKPNPAVEPIDITSEAQRTMNLPNLQQLLSSGQISVAPLSVDLHVYAGDPGQRFIFINMKKYREGERLQEGPSVEEITDRGVILSYQGNRFIVDRQ
jgi:general secretion pathway protein B